MTDLKTDKQPVADIPVPSFEQPKTSRALNISATEQAVSALCKQHGLDISTIEPLQSGGTRIVLKKAIDAESLRGLMKAKLIHSPVVRSSLHVARKPVPFSQH